MRLDGGRVLPSHGQSRYCVVPSRAPDIVALSVVQIRLPHHTIYRRQSRRFPPNTTSIEEQVDDHCGSESSRRFLSWQSTFRSAHQGETCSPPSADHVRIDGSDWNGGRELWV